jgi:cell division protein FtsI (penicillin-binding protein 3)
MFVLGVLGALALVVFARAFQLQVLDREFLRSEGDKRQIRTVVIPGHRGAILDRRGEPLALSAPVSSIWAVPSEVLAHPDALLPLASALGRPPSELQAHLQERMARKFVYLRENLSPAETQKVLALKVPGVFSEPSYARYYPAGEVASQVVGFAGRDGVGLEGIERAEQRRLTGTPGKRRVIRDRTGRVIEDGLEFVPAAAGETLNLTLDLRVQYLAYRELKAAVAESNAKGGLIVIADAHSGEILAIAAQPGFNPNNPNGRGDSAGVRNRAVTDSFEPGSTVKPLLVAQALELGLYQPDSVIDVAPGFMKVGALTVRDISKQGVIDLATVLAKSSNVGTAKMGLAMGAENVWAGYQRFGLGDPVFSGFPGEAAPVLRHYTDWGQIATATASYGYGLSVSALHLLRAYAGLANDGLMPQLSLVQGGISPPPQRAVSATTARSVRKLLEAAVAPGGSGNRAAIEGYRVSGKSGTVRKVAAAGGYDTDRHQAVFIGMVPVDQPQLVGMVMIDEPQGAYYGGQVAAPVFGRVMQGAARLLQIPPDLAPPLTQTAALGEAP